MILDLYMFGHRVTEIGALQAPFDNRYSWFQIKSVRDAHTQSDPRQCVHLCCYFYLSPAMSERFFKSVSPSLPRNHRFCQTPPAIPLSSHCRATYGASTRTPFTNSFYIFENTLHYPPYPPTRVQHTFTGLVQCRQHIVLHYVIEIFLGNVIKPTRMCIEDCKNHVEILSTEIDQSGQRFLCPEVFSHQ